jgi:hypothetical protein
MAMRLLVHGSGFARPFKQDKKGNHDPEELRCGKPKEVRGNPDGHWSPSTIDWEALGKSSGGSSPAATVNDLLNVLSGQGVETVDELRIIGHSNGPFLALGGVIQPYDPKAPVKFDEPTMLGSSATFLAAAPRFRQLQNRLKPDAKIVLAGCGSGGVNSDLLELISTTMLRTVQGFKQPIMYAIDGTTSGPEVFEKGTKRPLGRRIDDDAKITVRGKAMYSTAANAIEDLFGSDLVGTSALKTDAWLLKPDAESKAGNIFDAVTRFKARPWVITAAEVGYKLLRAFFPSQSANVPGVGFGGDLAGLRVAADSQIKTKMGLEVGKGFVDRLSPRTLEQRVKELGQALDMVLRRSPGVVPAR